MDQVGDCGKFALGSLRKEFVGQIRKAQLEEYFQSHRLKRLAEIESSSAKVSPNKNDNNNEKRSPSDQVKTSNFEVDPFEISMQEMDTYIKTKDEDKIRSIIKIWNNYLVEDIKNQKECWNRFSDLSFQSIVKQLLTPGFLEKQDTLYAIIT